MHSLSAYVPCFNNAATISAALHSLQQQSLAPDELFLIDDHSSDHSCTIAEALGVAVVSMRHNSGRGAVRSKALEIVQHEFVVSCDATNFLPADFVARALPHFSDPRVAAVFGRIWQSNARTPADRWRGRHLFKIHEALPLQHGALLSTYGCVLRRSAVLDVGNFNPSLRHSEDVELGQRLLAAGYDVIFDPSLHVISGVSNSWSQVLERYWRWHAGPAETISLLAYARQVWYSLRVMVYQDLLALDLATLPMSLLCPHYQFWRSFLRCYYGRVQHQ